MCAIEAGRRGRRVMVVDHAPRPAEKIRISGGGRCNFTNIHSSPDYFLSGNPKFPVSALARYTPQHFLSMVQRHGIAYHEKKLGQLFCDHSSRQIIDMLLSECRATQVQVMTGTSLCHVERGGDRFRIETSAGILQSRSFVVASGGLSIPKMGASGIGYDIARQFQLHITPTRPALVPLVWSPQDLADWKELAGVSFTAEVRTGKRSFAEAVLFTHRGLSGPAILQISSYWAASAPLTVNIAPQMNAADVLIEAKRLNPRQDATTILAATMPRRLAHALTSRHLGAVPPRMGNCSDEKLNTFGGAINRWTVIPAGNEGYRIAEVTLGGVDTGELSSQTMESRNVSGLYFIGEVVDVTGHLGGHNFQWAWASGHAAGQVV